MKFFSSRWKKPRRNSDSSTRDTRSSAGNDPVITPSFLSASYDPPERASHHGSSHGSNHSSHDGGTSHHFGGHDHGGSHFGSHDSGSSGGSDGGGGGGGGD